jgi:hypothetical protein
MFKLLAFFHVTKTEEAHSSSALLDPPRQVPAVGSDIDEPVYLVPSADPETPVFVEDVFAGISPDEVVPAVWDTPYDPSAGLPATTDGAPIVDDARLLWRLNTGRAPLKRRGDEQG